MGGAWEGSRPGAARPGRSGTPIKCRKPRGGKVGKEEDRQEGRFRRPPRNQALKAEAVALTAARRSCRLAQTGAVELRSAPHSSGEGRPHRSQQRLSWGLFHPHAERATAYCSSVPWSSSLPFSSSGGMMTAAATLSPSSRLSSRTPCVARPAARICLVSTRMILPN